METKDYPVGDLVKSVNTITGSFSAFKAITIASLALTFLAFIGGIWYVGKVTDEVHSKVYIIDNGGNVTSASSQDASLSRGLEVNDQVRRFHELFFNIPPDETMVRRNTERALELADRSVYDYYETLRESGFYRGLSSSDAYQQVDIKSIDVDMEHYPYKCILTCDQYISRPSNIAKYNLVTSCYVQEVPRSEKNMHGLLITEFRVIENTQLEVRKK